ncbi:MAG: glycosyltransferase [Hyphomonadaceae bacterium]|nr:glycosyltransferase [Hyphomonadaceae bacterium]
METIHPLTIVTPVYEDVRAFRHLLADLRAACGAAVYVVAVDDGSIKEPLAPEVISEAGLNGMVLRLVRNIGHQSAIAIGLSYVAENAPSRTVVVMDCDGEDAPGSIADLTRRLAEGNVDIAVAQRRTRRETLSFQAFYAVYKPMFRLLTGRDLGFGNFMAIQGRAVKRLVSMSELWIHVAATVIASKLRVARVPVDRQRRYAGESKMNFVSLALHGFRAMMVFSEDVLVRTGTFVASLIGVVTVVVAAAGALKILGYATPGWLTTVVGLSLIIVLQTGTLTLTTLLTSGVIKSASLNTPNYRRFVEAELEAKAVEVAPPAPSAPVPA